jgi:hypothetical protein
MWHGISHKGSLFVTHLTHDFGWDTRDQHIGWHFHALADDRASCDNGTVSDDATTKQSCAHTNQDIIANFSSVNNRTMTNRASRTNFESHTSIAMNHAAVLDVSLRANRNGRIITTNNRLEPDRNLVS